MELCPTNPTMPPDGGDRNLIDIGDRRSNKAVIKTRSRSESDLEDGYTWRKYGKKYIKGNPYPRSYFKCKGGGRGCLVKKQTQRCGDDPEFVLTTYQGTHDHPPHKPAFTSTTSPYSPTPTNRYDLRYQVFGEGCHGDQQYPVHEESMQQHQLIG